MSRDDHRAGRAADHGLGVVDHLGHRHADRRLVAEQHLAQRIADEQQRDPGLVEQLRGREVVRRQHRQLGAVGVLAGDVDDGQAAGRVGGGAHAGSEAGCRVVPVCAAPSRASSAAATRSRMRSATSRLVSCGRSVRAPSAVEDRDPVRVGAEPGARLRHVVRDEEVHALAAELLGRPLQRAGLGREADEHGPGLDGPDRLGDGREQVRRRFELERQPVGARQLAVRGGGRPEVRHGGGHHEGIEAGGRAVAGRDALERGLQLGGGAGADDGQLRVVGEGHLEVGGEQRDPRARDRGRRGPPPGPSCRSSGCR